MSCPIVVASAPTGNHELCLEDLPICKDYDWKKICFFSKEVLEAFRSLPKFGEYQYCWEAQRVEGVLPVWAFAGGRICALKVLSVNSTTPQEWHVVADQEAAAVVEEAQRHHHAERPTNSGLYAPCHLPRYILDSYPCCK